MNTKNLVLVKAFRQKEKREKMKKKVHLDKVNLEKSSVLSTRHTKIALIVLK